MSLLNGERRNRRREAAFFQRRRYPRFFLDVDWFVESQGCSTLGRGLEISLRGAMLPLMCLGKFTGEVTVHIALPGRAKMFKAKGQALPRQGRGWVIQFHEVAAADLGLLAQVLIEEYGLAAVPNLERKYGRLVGIHGNRSGDSI